MAFHHAAIFFTIMYIWFLGANAHNRRELRPQSSEIRSPRTIEKYAIPRQQPRAMRPTRGIDKYLVELSTARGYGKRAADYNMPNIPNIPNKYLFEMMALESIMRRLGVPRNPSRNENTLLE